MSLQNIKLNISNSERQTIFNTYKANNPLYLEEPVSTTYNVLMQEWQKLLLYLNLKKFNLAGWNIKEDFLEGNNIKPKTLLPTITTNREDSSIYLEEENTSDIAFSWGAYQDTTRSIIMQSNGYYYSNDFFKATTRVTYNAFTKDYQPIEEFWYTTRVSLPEVSSYVAPELYPYKIKYNNLNYFFVRRTTNYTDNHFTQSILLVPEISLLINPVGNVKSAYEYIMTCSTGSSTSSLIYIQSCIQDGNMVYVLFTEGNSTTYSSAKILCINLENLSTQLTGYICNISGNEDTFYKIIEVNRSTNEIYFLRWYDTNLTIIYSANAGSSFAERAISNFTLNSNFQYLLDKNTHNLYIYGTDDDDLLRMIQVDYTDTSYSDSNINAFPGTDSVGNIMAVTLYKDNLLCLVNTADPLDDETSVETGNNLALVLLDKTNISNLLYLNSAAEPKIQIYRTGTQYLLEEYTDYNPRDFCLFVQGDNLVIGCNQTESNKMLFSVFFNKEIPVVETVDDPLAYAYVDFYHETGKELRLGFCYNLPSSRETIRDNYGNQIYFNNFFMSYSEEELKDIREEPVIAYNFATTNLFDLSNYRNYPTTQGIFAWEIKIWLELEARQEELEGLPPIQYTISLDSSGNYIDVFIGGYYSANQKIEPLGNLMAGKLLKNGTQALMNFGQVSFSTASNPWVPITFPSWYNYENGQEQHFLYIIALEVNENIIYCGGKFIITDKFNEQHEGQIIIRPISCSVPDSPILIPPEEYRLLTPIQVNISSLNESYFKNGKNTGIVDLINSEYCCCNNYELLTNKQGYLLENGKYIINHTYSRLPVVKWEPNLPASDNPYNPMA